MADRLRTWTLYDPGEDEPIHANGPAFYGLDERDGIRVVEWDREKVVPIIAVALTVDFDPRMTAPEGLRAAEIIFDALDREPDVTARSPEYEWRLASTWTASGLDCAIVEMGLGDPMGRWWCGCVRVPEGHPWHGRDCEDINSTSDGLAFGGITWSGEMPERLGDGWWVGFDTAHGTRPWDWKHGHVVNELRRLARKAGRAAREAA